MNRIFKAMRGVTLLEVMLVLAIAAMIIVMSVRYYQSANATSQSNTVVSTVTAIAAAGDQLAAGAGGSYAGLTQVAISNLLPPNSMTTPWGSAITITAFVANGYLITVPQVPVNQCSLVSAKVTANPSFTTATPCAAAAPTDLKFTYTAT